MIWFNFTVLSYLGKMYKIRKDESELSTNEMIYKSNTYFM